MEAQLLGYEKFWDIISVEKTLYNSAVRRGLAKGMAQGIQQGIQQGIEQGIQQGIEQGRSEEKVQIALNMKAQNIPAGVISQCTGIPVEEIEML